MYSIWRHKNNLSVTQISICISQIVKIQLWTWAIVQREFASCRFNWERNMQHLLNPSPGSSQPPPPGSYSSQKQFPCSGSHCFSLLPLDSQQAPNTKISSLPFGFIWQCSDCLVLETMCFVSLQDCLLANTPSKLQSILAFSPILFSSRLT